MLNWIDWNGTVLASKLYLHLTELFELEVFLKIYT